MYRDDVLRPHVVPMFSAHPELQIFQQDNGRPHTARVYGRVSLTTTSTFFHGRHFPQMAPVEHVWDEIERRIAAGRQPTTVALNIDWCLSGTTCLRHSSRLL